MSLRVPLTLACWDYDRTLPLAQGDVRPAGIDLIYLNLPVEETFFRMARFREFEAAELSLSSYVISLGQDAPFVAIPVFPSRAFRHNGIYVHAGRGISQPADLAGRLVGVPEYQLTAAVWIRGILAERHGLPVPSVRYRTGGLHQPGRTDKIAHGAPPGVRDSADPGRPDAGRDAGRGRPSTRCTARAPRRRSPLATRGWPGCFPTRGPPRRSTTRTPGSSRSCTWSCCAAMCTSARPWLARSLYQAFEEARALTMARMAETAATRYLVPWLYADLERTQQVMGADFWTYGLAAGQRAHAAHVPALLA